ncbi:MAG: class I adenylate-forming enzyme family protein [Acidimicrobiales bacterium]
MPSIIAIAGERDERYAEAIRRIWDQGDVFFPLDLRLSPALQSSQLELVGPHAIMTTDGELHPCEYGHRAVVQDGDAYIVLTSGTTGAPKAVIHTHQSVRSSVEASLEALAFDPQTDRWICALPPAHVGGLSVILRALHTKTPVDILSSFDPIAIEEAQRRGATHISIVRAALATVDISRFKTVLYGAQAPPSDLPKNVVTTYGMTETGSGVVYDGTPLQGVEITIDETSSEILLRAPMLARAYGDGSSLTDRDGYFHSGDLGYFNDEGRLCVKGRITDVVNTGGEKVFPTPVEELLESLPSVREAAIIGVPDPIWGELVTAVIVAEPTASTTPSLAELSELIRAHFEPWVAPRQGFLAPSLPRTNLGKLQRNTLRTLINQLPKLN